MCCCLWEYYRNSDTHTHTHKHTQPTGKTTSTQRDGDCSITMVTQMGPRERPASLESGGKSRINTCNTDKLIDHVYCHMFTDTVGISEWKCRKRCLTVPACLPACPVCFCVFTWAFRPYRIWLITARQTQTLFSSHCKVSLSLFSSGNCSRDSIKVNDIAGVCSISTGTARE